MNLVNNMCFDFNLKKFIAYKTFLSLKTKFDQIYYIRFFYLETNDIIIFLY